MGGEVGRIWEETRERSHAQNLSYKKNLPIKKKKQAVFQFHQRVTEHSEMRHGVFRTRAERMTISD